MGNVPSLLLGFALGAFSSAWLLSRGRRRRGADRAADGEVGAAGDGGRGDDEEEVLVFPDSAIDPSMPEEERIRLYKQVLGGSRPLSRLLEHLSGAKESVDVCVYLITSQQLAQAVLGGIARGVRVRLICDDSMFAVEGSQVKEFYKAGAKVRHRPSSFLMHHKFAVVDSRKVVSGSFNWTMKAVMGNAENVVVTTRPRIVRGFRREFDKLWAELSRDVKDD